MYVFSKTTNISGPKRVREPNTLSVISNTRSMRVGSRMVVADVIKKKRISIPDRKHSLVVYALVRKQ